MSGAIAALMTMIVVSTSESTNPHTSALLKRIGHSTRVLSLPPNQPHLRRLADRFGPVQGLQLLQDMPHVGLDRVLRDKQLAGDLGGGLALRQADQHLHL